MSTDNEAAAVAVEEKAVEYAEHAKWYTEESRWFQNAGYHISEISDDHPGTITEEHLRDRLKGCEEMLRLLRDGMRARARTARDRADSFRLAAKALRGEL